jgi:quaternary ammonium compound-resistance protein SugE
MAWLLLIVGGFCELGWLISLKYSAGFTRFWPSVVTVIFMIASISCLGYAVKSIPLGTAYAVWTGTSIAAAAAAGVYLFDESTTLLRIVSIAFIIIGIVGLRLES